MLDASGLAIEPAALVDEVYLPASHGSLQLEIIAATRRHERIPYRLDPDWPAIMQQLLDGRPVLVLLNLGLKTLPVYHYAVVIGYQADSDTVLLRSGTKKRAQMSLRKFMDSWHRAGDWALVILQPGVLPIGVDRDRYLKTIISLEQTGEWNTALVGYRAAVSRWPDDALAHFGLANALRTQGRLEQAIEEYRNVLELEPQHLPAINNLADTLMQLGHCKEAARVMDTAVLLDDTSSETRDAIQSTRVEIGHCQEAH